VATPMPPSQELDAGKSAERIGTRRHSVFDGRTLGAMTGPLDRSLPGDDCRDFERVGECAFGVAIAIRNQPSERRSK